MSESFCLDHAAEEKGSEKGEYDGEINQESVTHITQL